MTRITLDRRKGKGGAPIGNWIARWNRPRGGRYRYNTQTKDRGLAEERAQAEQAKDFGAAPPAAAPQDSGPTPVTSPGAALPSDSRPAPGPGPSGPSVDAFNIAWGLGSAGPTAGPKDGNVDASAPPPVPSGRAPEQCTMLADMIGRTAFLLHGQLNQTILRLLRDPEAVARFKNEVADKLMEAGWMEGMRIWMGPAEAGPMGKVAIGMGAYLSIGLMTLPKKPSASAREQATEPEAQPEPEPEPAPPPPAPKAGRFGRFGGMPTMPNSPGRQAA